MPQTIEERRAKERAYRQTPTRKKSNRISNWKTAGIICADWDALYERYLNTTHCETCDVLLTSGGWSTRTTKCLDHDHSINDRDNVRAVLCGACNLNDRCDNTSGVPNVNYHKLRGCWQYQKVGSLGVRHRIYFKTKQEAIRYKYEFESDLEASFERINSTTEVRGLP